MSTDGPADGPLHGCVITWPASARHPLLHEDKRMKKTWKQTKQKKTSTPTVTRQTCLLCVEEVIHTGTDAAYWWRRDDEARRRVHTCTLTATDMCITAHTHTHTHTRAQHTETQSRTFARNPLFPAVAAPGAVSRFTVKCLLSTQLHTDVVQSSVMNILPRPYVTLTSGPVAEAQQRFSVQVEAAVDESWSQAGRDRCVDAHHQQRRLCLRSFPVCLDRHLPFNSTKAEVWLLFAEEKYLYV